MVDLSGVPVVDVHGHPFLNKGAVTAEQFTNLTAFGGGSQAYMEQGGVAFTDEVRGELQRVKRDTVYFKRMVRDLAAFLGTEPEIEAVLARCPGSTGSYRLEASGTSATVRAKKKVLKAKISVTSGLNTRPTRCRYASRAQGLRP